MKFWAKLSLGIMALVGVLFTLGGMLLVWGTFQTALDDAVGYNTDQHILEKYALEADLLANTSTGLPVDESMLTHYGERLAAYLGTGSQPFALYLNEALVYNALPIELPDTAVAEALAVQSEAGIIQPTENHTFFLLASALSSGGATVALVNAYDICAIYSQRAQNLEFFWRLAAALLAVTALVTLLFARLLTRPVGRLNEASRTIASGEYSRRAAVHTHDEIGELAASFNQMAEAVEEKIDALELSLAQRNDFVAAFTHEVKTPMTTLIGYAALLRGGEQPPEVRERAASAIFHEAKRLEALSQRLLALMGLGEKPPTLAPCTLSSIFMATARSLESGPSLAPVHFPATPLTIMAEPVLLADLLRNLILNARAATPPEGAITVTATPKGGNCFIEVQDSGHGIPEEELGRICEPFYMIDKARSRSAGGTGLGLALSQRIAALHGSTLAFQSEVGKGTTVSFTVPLAEKEGGL